MSQPPETPSAREREWWAEFEANRRRPLPVRFRYSFIKTYKPVMDDAKFRAFDTTAAYRDWCEQNLPDWLGYGRVYFKFQEPGFKSAATWSLSLVVGIGACLELVGCGLEH